MTSGGKQANQSFLSHSARNLGLRYIVDLPFWDKKLSVMVYITYKLPFFLVHAINLYTLAVFGCIRLDSVLRARSTICLAYRRLRGAGALSNSVILNLFR